MTFDEFNQRDLKAAQQQLKMQERLIVNSDPLVRAEAVEEIERLRALIADLKSRK